MKKRFKGKFTQVYNIALSKIKVQPKIFQGRTVPFAKSTVEKIVREGFDKSQEPIILFKNSKGENLVISGHSRFEAAKKLYKKGNRSLRTIPVKYFVGDLDDAIDYAVIESNRSGKAEGIESDVKTYIRATQRGFNKDYLRGIFKSDGYIHTLKMLSKLNAKGDFIKQLSKESHKSFPYLIRNAGWVGLLRMKYPELTNNHEKEMFDFFYKSDKKNLNVKKQSFFDNIKTRVESPYFTSKKRLQLNKKGEFDLIKKTDPGYKLYQQYLSAIDQWNAKRLKKDELSVYANQQGKKRLAKELEKESFDLGHRIKMKYIEVMRLRSQLQKEDKRLKTGGLF